MGKRNVNFDIWWPERPESWGVLRRYLMPHPGTLIMTLLLVGSLLWAQSAGALPQSLISNIQSPSSTGTIAYQGRLADSAGNPLTGQYPMIFRLYDVAADGVHLWEEQWTGPNSVQVSDGLFNVMLGSITPIPQDVITTHDSLFLGITVGADDEMIPRVQLGSVPFAVQALTVPDGSVSTAKLADGAVTSAKIQDGDVASSDVGFNYAGSATKGGAANDVACSNCIAGGEIQDGQVSSNDVGFKYAGSSSKGGAASDVACSNCIASGEIQDGQVRTADLVNGAVTTAKININDHLDMNKKNIVGIGNLVFPYDDARAIQYRGSSPYGLAIQTVNDSGGDVVRMELGIGNYPNVHIKNARLNMNGNPIINQGAMIEAGLQTPDELASEFIQRFTEGDVLCWPGKRLEKCNRVNDRRVVAVADENGKPIVIGAEPIKVLGPVKVGDLLVASGVAGYAVVNNQPAPGTVIAKALETLDGEKGLVKAMIRTP